MTASRRLPSPRRERGARDVAAERAPLVPAARWTSLARAGYGAVLLFMPGHLIMAATGHPASGHVRVTARVLGARHLTQAAIISTLPVRGLIAAGAAADGLHAASMLLFTATERQRRVAVLADTLIEAAFTAAAMAALRR